MKNLEGKMKNILCIILLFSSVISAQQIKSWQNYTNMQNISGLAAKNDIIWAATNGGVFSYSYSDSSYQILTKSEGLSSHSITAIEIDTSNKIWIGSSEGYINIYDPSTNNIKTIFHIFNANETNKKINDILVSNDTCFVSTEFGLILFNTTDFSILDNVLKFGIFNVGTPVRSTFINDKIYVVTQAGIAVQKDGVTNLQAPESWDNIELGVQLSASIVYELFLWESELYAATDRGIYRYSMNTWTNEYYSSNHILDVDVKSDILYSIVAEYNSSNDVWSRSSLHVLSEKDSILYSKDDEKFTTIEVLEQDEFILGTEQGILINKLSNNKIVFPNGPAINSISSISVDYQGNLWTGTGKDGLGIGVLKFDKDTWTVINQESIPVFLSNQFHKVSSSNEAVYFSNWGRGFARYKDSTFTNFDHTNTDIVGVVEDIDFIVIDEVVEDAKGNAWVLNFRATNEKPISVLTADDEWFHYSFDSPLFSQLVDCKNIVVDQFDTKWFAVVGKGDEGLYYFNENSTFEDLGDDVWGKITKSNGLRDEIVNALAVDQFGELLIGTSVGVDVIPNPSSPTSIIGDQYIAIRQQTINSIAVDPINQKWFGTTNGIFLMSSDGSSLLANYTKDNSPLPSDNIKSLAIDRQDGIIYAGTDFGITAISTFFIEPTEKFDDLYVYPNPIELSNSESNNLVIEGLIEDSEIKILDISGKVVNEFKSIGGRTTTWNCKSSSGELISSGIYIVVAFDSEVNEIGHAKFAVLRK